MPKFRFTIEAVGRTTTDIIAEDEVEARAIYEDTLPRSRPKHPLPTTPPRC
jgi:hypothetical protein